MWGKCNIVLTSRGTVKYKRTVYEETQKNTHEERPNIQRFCVYGDYMGILTGYR